MEPKLLRINRIPRRPVGRALKAGDCRCSWSAVQQNG